MTCVVETVQNVPTAKLLAIHAKVGHATCSPGAAFLQSQQTMAEAWAACPRPEWLYETMRMFNRKLPEAAGRQYMAKIVLAAPSAGGLPGDVRAALELTASGGHGSLPSGPATGLVAAAVEALYGTLPRAMQVVENQIRATVAEAETASVIHAQATVFRAVVGDLFV